MPHIIPNYGEKINRFINNANTITRSYNLYARIRRSDFLHLNSAQFFVYCDCRSLANFRTQTVNYRQQYRFSRTNYSKRNLRRYTGQLEEKGRIKKIGLSKYYVLPYRRGKPIRLQFLAQIKSPEAAAIARFLLMLAFWHGSWDEITVRHVQKALNVSTRMAGCMLAWLRNRGNCIHKRTLRAIIFRSERPAWHNHHYHKKPSAEYIKCFSVVRVHESPNNRVYEISNQYAVTGESGSFPPGASKLVAYINAIGKKQKGVQEKRQRREKLNNIPGNMDSLKNYISGFFEEKDIEQKENSFCQKRNFTKGSDPPQDFSQLPLFQALPKHLQGFYYIQFYFFIKTIFFYYRGQHTQDT